MAPVRLPADAELPLLRTRVSDLADRALVDALALGPEPAMRACPSCDGPCRADAQRCGSCWKPLPPVPAAKTEADADAKPAAAASAPAGAA